MGRDGERAPGALAASHAAAAGESSRLSWALLLVVLVLAAALRWRVLDAPLERDEGEYAYFGQLLLQGVPPYAAAYNMKLPGIYALYAGILAAFGETARGIHLGLLVANALSTALVFLLGRRLLSAAAGVAAAALFALLSLLPAVQGAYANAEAFVLPFALWGWLLVERALARRDSAHPAVRPGALLLAGAVLGTGALVKQHGAAFVLLAALRALLASGRGRAARGLWVLAGGAAVYGATCLTMLLAGVFDDFWLWTFEYARAYAGQVGGASAWSGLRAIFGPIAASSPPIWILAAAGLLLTAARASRARLSLLCFAAASAVAVAPGFYFRPHYFVLALPAAALLASQAAEALGRWTSWPRASAGALIVLGLAWGAVRERAALFQLSPDGLTRAVFGQNPFVESVELGALARELTEPTDRIVVVGSEPQIYFYARRRAATGFVYTYALMEDQPYALDMQRRMIREIVEADPALALFVDSPTSWLAREDSPRLILEWFAAWAANRERVASLRFSGRDGWRLVRDPRELAQPASGPKIDVYRRP